MTYKDFHVGEKVIYTDVAGLNPELDGLVGTVMCLNDEYRSVGVQFDEIDWGHDLDGACKYGMGWYCGPQDLQRTIEDVCEIKISFDEFMKGER